MERKLVPGILANVDAGKTTYQKVCSYVENRENGRVDKQDIYLIQMKLKSRELIFFKTGCFGNGSTQISHLDTPGHGFFNGNGADLQVLDYAILLISGPEGAKAIP